MCLLRFKLANHFTNATWKLHLPSVSLGMLVSVCWISRYTLSTICWSSLASSPVLFSEALRLLIDVEAVCMLAVMPLMSEFVAATAAALSSSDEVEVIDAAVLSEYTRSIS